MSIKITITPSGIEPATSGLQHSARYVKAQDKISLVPKYVDVLEMKLSIPSIVSRFRPLYDRGQDLQL
jgi:hypothetical protein